MGKCKRNKYQKDTFVLDKEKNKKNQKRGKNVV